VGASELVPCNVSPLFRLSGSTFWTSNFEANYTRTVDLKAPDLINNAPPNYPGPGALCVRSAQ